MRWGISASLCVLGLLWGHSVVEAAPWSKSRSTLYLNGVKEKVYWSDGDTFRVLSGKHRGLKARLKGFNTLESYGPVHRWGKWKPKGLARIADLATDEVRRGVWRCATKGKRDRYNRALVSCPGLAKVLLQKGLAHMFGVPKGKLRALHKAQQSAIKARRGMWARGVPAQILTSVHSTSEGQVPAYNRLISTATGKWTLVRHRNHYRSCQWVCYSGACLLYVPYKRRYGWKRAPCLR